MARMAAVFCVVMSCFPSIFGAALGCVRYAVKRTSTSGKTHSTPGAEPVDNYSPTLGNIEEFNIFDVFFALLGWGL